MTLNTPSAPPVRGHALLDEWKRLTQAGLQAHQAHCTTQAMAWHVQALQVAQRLMQQPPPGVDDDDRLAALVVAHLNLADCYADLGQHREAADCVDCASHTLMGLLQNPTTPMPLRQAALRHLRETFAAQRRFGDARETPHACTQSFPPAIPGPLLH